MKSVFQLKSDFTYYEFWLILLMNVVFGIVEFSIAGEPLLQNGFLGKTEILCQRSNVYRGKNRTLRFEL